MNIVIREISDDSGEISSVKTFLYGQIKKVYGIGPNLKFHYDIEDLEKYYVSPERNTLFMAFDGEKIVATGAIRAYDLDYEFFRDVYSGDDTAGIWRLMVDEDYRRMGIASAIVEEMEKFAKDERYSQIYLHTHRYLDSALSFWKSMGYEVTVEENDYDETSHMVKYL